MKRLGLAFAILGLLTNIALAQVGGLAFPGPGTAHGAGAPYTGPGDSQTFAVWGSVARVYNAASASTSTSLADLVASTGGAPVCTLRGSATGFADVSASYCAGTTPPLACAAASGGSCKVSKLYDGTGGGHPWTQATLANMPSITFSGIHSLPSLVFVSANSQGMFTTGFYTASQPYTLEVVAIRTANFTSTQETIALTAPEADIAFASSANTITCYGGAVLTAPATDSAPHAIQTTFNSTSSTINVDGATQVVGNAGTVTQGAGPVSLGVYTSSLYLDGQISEAGIYSTSYNSTVQSNTRSAYGL